MYAGMDDTLKEAQLQSQKTLAKNIAEHEIAMEGLTRQGNDLT